MRQASYRTSEGAHPGLFPAEAGPTDTPRALSGTGFSRECVRRHTAKSDVALLGLFPAEAGPTKALRVQGYSGASLLNAIPAARITAGHGLAVHAQHFGCRLIGCARRIEIALLHGVAVAVVAVLFYFLLRLA